MNSVQDITYTPPVFLYAPSLFMSHLSENVEVYVVMHLIERVRHEEL
jgi:hypothetical protein